MEIKKHKELLNLARNAIESKLNKKELVVDELIKEEYSEKGACFVTLTMNGNLRGCIGSLQARQELWKDVVDNARNAAFNDYRFRPVNLDELKKIKIEVSVLTKPKLLGKGSEVFDKITNNLGIILKQGFRSATFLPQVWEQIPNKTIFLEELSMKAGLSPDSWKDAQISFYKVESVEEE